MIDFQPYHIDSIIEIEIGSGQNRKNSILFHGAFQKIDEKRKKIPGFGTHIF